MDAALSQVPMAPTLSLAPVAAALAVAAGVHAFVGLVAAVPPDGARRPSLPPLFRLLWPLVRVLGHHLGVLVPARLQRPLARPLRRAELHGALRPVDALAAVAVHGLLGGLGGGAFAAGFGLDPALPLAIGAALGLALPPLQCRDRIARREAAIRRELPTWLDVLTLAVEGGCSLQVAIGHATEKAPDGALKRGFERLLGEIRAGATRAEALRSFDEWMAMPAVTALVGALLQADRTGASLGPVLRAQASQRTQERFARAEKLAMEAPVKLLGPLILCIFPCTFIVLGYPIVLRLMEGF